MVSKEQMRRRRFSMQKNIKEKEKKSNDYSIWECLFYYYFYE